MSANAYMYKKHVYFTIGPAHKSYIVFNILVIKEEMQLANSFEFSGKRFGFDI